MFCILINGVTVDAIIHLYEIFKVQPDFASEVLDIGQYLLVFRTVIDKKLIRIEN